MQLKFTHDIENNVFSTVITIDSFGTEQLSEDEEKELLNDFPTKVAYRNMTFSKNIKMNGTVPEVTSDAESEGTVIAVSLPPVSNKEILIDEDMTCTYKIDVNKITTSAIDESVLTTKELVAQAYCLIFDETIREAIETAMTELRAKAPAFTGETIVDV